MKPFLSALIFALMLSALTGVVVYRWQANEHVTKDMEYTRKIADLEEKILQNAQQITQPTNTPDTCEGFSAEPATSIVSYGNPEWGIELSIPFNDTWGYPEEPAEPYIELEEIDGLLFGVPREVEKCRWAYTYQFTVLPSRTQQQMEADILERNASRIESGEITKEQTITPVKISVAPVAFTYDIPGFCLAKSIEIVSQNHNYIVTACYADLEELKEVVSGLKIL